MIFFHIRTFITFPRAESWFIYVNISNLLQSRSIASTTTTTSWRAVRIEWVATSSNDSSPHCSIYWTTQLKWKLFAIYLVYYCYRLFIGIRNVNDYLIVWLWPTASRTDHTRMCCARRYIGREVKSKRQGKQMADGDKVPNQFLCRRFCLKAYNSLARSRSIGREVFFCYGPKSGVLSYLNFRRARSHLSQSNKTKFLSVESYLLSIHWCPKADTPIFSNTSTIRQLHLHNSQLGEK